MKLTQSWFKQQRQELVNDLLKRGIKDERVLRAMGKVPRERFVPRHLRETAYYDGPLPIGDDQTISQPYVVALMTELAMETHPSSADTPLLSRAEGPSPAFVKTSADRQEGRRVLEVGTGSGYQTAILCELFDQVYSVERIKKLSQRARSRLRRLEYKNVHLRAGDGSQGWPRWRKVANNKGFDAIIVTAGGKNIPEALKTQLAEGGRLIIPVGSSWGGPSFASMNIGASEGRQRLIRLTKQGNKFKKEDFGGVAFVPLVSE